jgi:hypothetical protein
MIAGEYREEFGLLRTRALSARSLSREQSRTRLTGYRASKKAQARFAAGRAMARSDELTRRRWVTTTERTVPEELEQRRCLKRYVAREIYQYIRGVSLPQPAPGTG